MVEVVYGVRSWLVGLLRSYRLTFTMNIIPGILALTLESRESGRSHTCA